MTEGGREPESYIVSYATDFKDDDEIDPQRFDKKNSNDLQTIEYEDDLVSTKKYELNEQERTHLLV